jgi:hypothetical protein
MTEQPTVGRIVHFYTTDTSKHFNGQGAGPYPAIVLQTFGDKYINLKVLHWGGDYDEGSVSHLDDMPNNYRYWVWPSRA